MTSFIKLSSDFSVSWNLDDMISKISNDIIDPNNNRSPYYHPSGIVHWQHYNTVNISFARNFYKTFSKECHEVTNKLMEIQQKYLKISTDNELMLTFINQNIVPSRVNIIRTMGGINVGVHCDSTRNSCINIGLKNSNTFRTRISDNQDINNFYNNSTETYTMNDGDVYLVNIKNSHCVEALTSIAEPRYIITYNLIL